MQIRAKVLGHSSDCASHIIVKSLSVDACLSQVHELNGIIPKDLSNVENVEK